MLNNKYANLAIDTTKSIRVLFHDQHIVVIEKPEFLRSAPGNVDSPHDNALQQIQCDFPQASIVHRLDMDTSGLMIFAQHKEATRAINRLFQAREIHKQYIAVVAGLVQESCGHIELPLRKDWPNRPLQKVDFIDGKASTTLYQVTERDAAYTRLLLTPITGRSHQLRLHLRSIGHPILGCDLYGDRYAYDQCQRLLLHASQLRFNHPITEQAMCFDCPPSF